MLRGRLKGDYSFPLVGAAILVTGLAAETRAAVILVNFDNGNNSLTNWNNLSSGNASNTGVNVNPDLSAGAVIDSTGAVVSGISITTNGFDGFRDNGATGYASGGTMASWTNVSAARIGWLDSSTASPATIVFSGLSNTETYTVDLISARSGAAIIGTYTLNGSTTATQASSTNFSSLSDGWTAGKVLTWSNVTPSGGSLTLLAGGTNFPIVNAIRLTTPEVPEPSAILSVAMLGLFGLRRRRECQS